MKSYTRMGRFIPILFFLFLFSISVLSYEEFPKVSGVNGTFLGDNIQVTDSSYSLVSRSHTSTSNRVADLNGDGTNEIIVFDISGNENTWMVYAYESKSMTAVDSINLNLTNNKLVSNFEIMDLDNDGLKDIIYVDEGLTNGCIKTLELNATNEFNVGYLNCDTALAGGSPTTFLLGCDSTSRVCAFGNAKQIVTDQALVLHFFDEENVTAPGDSVALFNDAGVNDGMCMSNIKHFPVGDFNPNNVNRIEVVTSYLVVDGGSEICMVVGSVNANNMSDVTKDVSNCRSAGGSIWTDANPQCIAEFYAYHISPPLVTDMNGFEGDGSEVIVAGSFDNENEFGLYMWNIDGSFIDSFPPVNAQNGRYVSNVFQANVMATSGYNDFCAIGFNSDDGDTNAMVCGSKINTAPLWWIFTTDTVVVDLPTNVINITPSIVNEPNRVYGVEHSDGNSFTEVLSTHGIYEIDNTDNDLNSLFSMPFSTGVVIPTDAEGVGWDDLVVSTSTGLVYYIDDGFTNSNCEDTGCTQKIYTNPCILETGTSSIIANRTDLEVRVQVVDLDGDDLNINVTLFEGAGNEQSQSALNQSSGTTYGFLFTLDGNVTNTGTLTVDVWDRENPSKIETNLFNFIVAKDGKVHGEDSCSQNVSQSGIISSPDVVDSPIGNILDNSVDDLQSMTGFTRQMLWYFTLLIILAFMGFHTFKQPEHLMGGIIFAVIFSFTWILAGTVFGYVPFGHLLVIISILFVGVAIYLTALFGIKSSSGGG